MSLEPPSERQPAVAPALDLDQLMEALRAEVEARKRKARDQGETGLAGEGLGSVLAMPDAEFVAAAYHLALGRGPSGEHEADASLNRLLLGLVTRTGLLRELVNSDEGRSRSARIEGLERAERRERASRGALARLRLNLADAARTIRLAPMRVVQFVRRVEQLERKLADTNLRLIALERELAALKAASRRDRD